MLSLVTGNKPIVAENMPETLLFDVHRISQLQLDFKTIVTASTMMLTTAHAISKLMAPADIQVNLYI